jgi:hypothetical protein
MKKVTLKQLQERIDELERQVRELQARPVYIPVFPPSNLPVAPQPWQPSLPTYPMWQQPYIGDSPNWMRDTTVICNTPRGGLFNG